MGEFPIPPRSGLSLALCEGVSLLCANDGSFRSPALPPVFPVSMIQAHGKELAIKY